MGFLPDRTLACDSFCHRAAAERQVGRYAFILVVVSVVVMMVLVLVLVLVNINHGLLCVLDWSAILAMSTGRRTVPTTISLLFCRINHHKRTTNGRDFASPRIPALRLALFSSMHND